MNMAPLVNKYYKRIEYLNSAAKLSNSTLSFEVVQGFPKRYSASLQICQLSKMEIRKICWLGDPYNQIYLNSKTYPQTQNVKLFPDLKL